MYEFSLPDAPDAAYLRMLDGERNLICRVDKEVRKQDDGTYLVELEMDDVPDGAAYFQLVTETNRERTEYRFFM